jgi:hypothetical protein
MEAAIMAVQSNIQSIIKNKTQILAGLFVGGMMAVTFMLPGNASADNPGRPVSQVESSVLIPTSNLANVIDMDFLDPGFYDAKFVRTNSGMDMGLLDPGFCNAKLVNSSRSIEGLQEDNTI